MLYRGHMPYTVGSAAFKPTGVPHRLRGDNALLEERRDRRPMPPLHAVEVADLDTVPANGAVVDTALCGAEILLFRQVWPNAVLPFERCSQCESLTKQ